MKQIYHAFIDWECYKNGMWGRVDPDEELDMLNQAIDFTGNHIEYGKAMRRVIEEWPITCEHHLTDKSINRKAHIGHCAVSLQLGIPEYITRMAWGHLTQEQQDKANKQAETAIEEYERTYNSIHQNVGKQMLLFGDSR